MAKKTKINLFAEEALQIIKKKWKKKPFDYDIIQVGKGKNYVARNYITNIKAGEKRIGPVLNYVK